MSDQDFWFEPVNLLARCSLNEVLLWVWAERVPVANVYREKNAFETLDEQECEDLGIPPVPENVRMIPQHCTEERTRARWQGSSRDTIKYYVTKGIAEAEAIKQWLPVISLAIELPATELFLKLRRGEIEANGKQLSDGTEIIDFVEYENSYSSRRFEGLADSIIPPAFWSMPGIDWLSNAVTAHGSCYCDVSMSVETLMRLFPGKRIPVFGAEFVGNCLVVKEDGAENVASIPKKTLGRPPDFRGNPFTSR